jgi:hypothetical protein
MDTKRNRSEAAITRPARTNRLPPAPKPELVKYSFNLDEIRTIRISIGSTGVVVSPPRPRPFKIELTIERRMR